MTWRATIDGKTFSFDDLPIVELSEIADRHETDWYSLTSRAPAADPLAYYEVLCLCAAQMGVEPPAKPHTVGETVKLLAMVEQVEPDLPKTWDEGGLPLAEGDADRMNLWFLKRFGWPPSVVREQTPRDLYLIMEQAEMEAM